MNVVRIFRREKICFVSEKIQFESLPSSCIETIFNQTHSKKPWKNKFYSTTDTNENEKKVVPPGRLHDPIDRIDRRLRTRSATNVVYRFEEKLCVTLDQHWFQRLNAI